MRTSFLCFFLKKMSYYVRESYSNSVPPDVFITKPSKYDRPVSDLVRDCFSRWSNRLSMPGVTFAGNIKYVLDAVRSTPDMHSMRSITFRGCKMNDKDIKDLVDFVCEFPNIKKVEITHRKFTDDSMPDVFRMLQNSSVYHLDFTENKFTEAGVSILICAIQVSNLTSLDLQGCQFDEVQSAGLLEAIKGLNLTKLNMGRNTLASYLAMCQLRDILDKGKLVELEIDKCELEDRDLDLIAPSISACKELKVLNINCNLYLSVSAVKRMFTAIGLHPSLVRICLSGDREFDRKCSELKWEYKRKLTEARLIVVLLSVRVIERIGCKSLLSKLPNELFRALKVMLF